jgi:hypothetical protein
MCGVPSHRNNGSNKDSIHADSIIKNIESFVGRGVEYHPQKMMTNGTIPNYRYKYRIVLNYIRMTRKRNYEFLDSIATEDIKRNLEDIGFQKQRIEDYLNLNSK